MRFIFVLGLAGPEGSTVPNESHAIAGMFMAVFERKLGDAGFARSPRSSAINSVVLSFVVRASGKSRLRLRASSSAIPLSLRGLRGGEKATVLAFCMSSPLGFEHARIRTGLGKNFSQYR